MKNRKAIESALQRVRSGELTPVEATQWLLSEDADTATPRVATDDSPSETLTSLMVRLGPPPPDIASNWRQQMCSIAARYEQATREPLPAIELDRWMINSQGELTCRDDRFRWHVLRRCDVIEEPSLASMNRIHEFHDALVSGAGSVVATGNSAVESLTHSSSAPVSQPKRTTQPSGRRMGLTARRVSFTLAMLGCTVATGLVLYKASGPETAPADEGLAAEPTAPATIAEVADVPQAASLSNGFGFSGAADSPETRETLETLESLTEAELSSLEAAENEAGNPFSLDELMPPPASFVPAREPSAEPEPGDIGATLKEEVPPADSVIPASESVQDLLEKNDLPGKEEAEPDESPQPTRTQSVMAVALSDIDEAGSTELSESKLTRLKLQFPLDVPLELEGDESDWSIRDTRKNVVVASVRAGDDGTQLKWTAGAGQSPSASALVHGRISGEDGSIFLRPTIEADPWKIRVDQHDVMPTWDLADPVPPRVTRVSIQFDLPDNVEEAWMEPIDSESPRRSRGLAVLTPEDGETVSLGLRFDVRCSRKLSCRIRYAGRLDPSMPWQVVSVPLLNQFADQLAQEATLVSNEAARLSRVYEIAGSAGRRILRVKQERNDARAEAIVQWSGRVAELQSLISTLEAEARLNVRVWVVWPDSEQELLTMQRESDDQR